MDVEGEGDGMGVNGRRIGMEMEKRELFLGKRCENKLRKTL